jgi:hypothetical protein
MTGVGTPLLKVNGTHLKDPGPLPPPSSVPEAAHVDELWVIKDPARQGGNPVQGPRDYDPVRLARVDTTRHDPLLVSK